MDWATLHPVERLELLTTHDLARQEKQKLELLRNLLTYYHYAASESREEVLRSEINRVRNAADEMRERLSRAQVNTPAAEIRAIRHRQPPREAPFNAPVARGELNGPLREVPFNGPQDNPRDPAPQAVHENGADYDDDDAHTQVINGRPRHRRDLG